MKEALINMVSLIVLDYFLIFVVSVVYISIMESKKLKDMHAKWMNIMNDFWLHIRSLTKIVKEDFKNNWIGISLLIISIVVLFILLIICAIIIPLEHNDWWNMFEKFLNNHPLLTNIFGTFIGIVFIFIILRPRVYIKKELKVSIIDNEKHLRVNAGNAGILPVNSVDVLLVFYRYAMREGKKIKLTRKISILRPDTPILRSHAKDEEDPTYGCASELTINQIRDIWEKQGSDHYDGILCRVKASHAISGITYVRECSFDKKVVNDFFIKECGNYTSPTSSSVDGKK